MMPSVSKKQHNFMEAVAHNAAFAKKAGIPQSVGKEFSTADKGKKFSKGGPMADKRMEPAGMQKVRTAAPSRDGLAEKGKTKGKVITMGGNTVGNGPIVNAGMKRGGMAKKK
jgi:hypothetical protein